MLMQGRSLFVKMGDKEVEYNKNFRLLLHTKLGNPHYPPEIQAETTLINFTVTEAGLEDQLLALVVNKERPDLEETKTQLIIQNTEFTIKLKQVRFAWVTAGIVAKQSLFSIRDCAAFWRHALPVLRIINDSVSRKLSGRYASHPLAPLSSVLGASGNHKYYMDQSPNMQPSFTTFELQARSMSQGIKASQPCRHICDTPRILKAILEWRLSILLAENCWSC